MGSLRDLDAEQQVALLFLMLFGLLVLVSASAIVLSLREGAEPTLAQQERHDRFVRDLRAAWIGATLFWLAWISGPVGSTLLFGVLSFLALREFITLTHTRRADHRSLILAFFVILPAQYLLAGGRWFDLFSVFVPVYAFVALPVASALAGDPKRFLERNAKIQWGVMVCVYGLSHAPALLLLDVGPTPGRGAFLVFFLVSVVAVGFIAQEVMAARLRARPIARQISRSFSYRAWALGVAAGMLAGVLLYWITPFEPGQALALGAIAAATGSLGELVMRALKRDAGVRTWGQAASVTGAVGLLDRVAPLAFAAPVFFHSVRWYFRAPV
ncbi:MAG: phosphatidate cytidylyltransferase [Burkholderiales bacterium]|nr:MAG: phosphatidate cytidylyltransferase [Burkholderiales bacterium]